MNQDEDNEKYTKKIPEDIDKEQLDSIKKSNNDEIDLASDLNVTNYDEN